MSITITSLITIFVASTTFAATPQSNNKIQAAVDIIDLSGDWDFAYTPERNAAPPVNDQYKAKMPIPGCWDDSLSRKEASELWPNARFNPDYAEIKIPVPVGDSHTPDASFPYLLGAGWYCRSIDVPEQWRGREIVLRIGRVVMEGHVYLNGKLVHHHLGHSMPWEAVLSKYLKYGEKNTLVICVDNRRDDRIGCAIRGWKGRSGGVFGPVSLKLSGKARIADWHVYPTDEHLQWHAEVEGEIAAGAELQWKVFDPKSGVTYGNGTSPAKGKIVAWETDKQGIPLWSDTDPNLVQIQIRLVENDHILDEVQNTFGLRQFKRIGVGLCLNEKPVFLRGVCEHAYFPETCTPPIGVDWYRRHIRRLKQIGFNWLRGHTWTLTEEYLQAADEIGMLVQVAPPRGYEMDEWLHIIRACRKHPSVVIYCCGNEENLDEKRIEFLRQCAYELKRLSPDALFNPHEALRGVEYHLENVVESLRSRNPFPHYPKRLNTLREFSDVFGQYPWSWLSYMSLRGPIDEINERLAIYDRPCLSHELGIIGCYLDLSLENRYRGTRISPELHSKVRKSLEQAGLSGRVQRYYQNSVAWHMLIAKQVCEKARRSRYISGYDMLGACDAHWHRSGYACGLLNEFDELKANTTSKDILCFNGPSIMMIDHHQKRNLFAGDLFQREVFVSWFGDLTLPATKLNWSLNSSDGNIIAKGHINTLPVLQGQVESLGIIKTPLPKLEKPIKTRLSVEISSRNIKLDNYWDYWIFPRVKSIKPRNLLVVNKIDNNTLEDLKHGGRVVLLGHEPFDAEETTFQMGVAGRPQRNLATVIEDHPLTDKFPHDGFCDWQFATMFNWATPIQFNKLEVLFDPIIEVVSSYKCIRKQAVLFECRVGHGRLLVCGLKLKDSDPAGAYFRQILLDYAVNNSFQPQTIISPKKLEDMIKPKHPTLKKQKETDKAFDSSAQSPVGR